MRVRGGPDSVPESFYNYTILYYSVEVQSVPDREGAKRYMKFRQAAKCNMQSDFG